MFRVFPEMLRVLQAKIYRYLFPCGADPKLSADPKFMEAFGKIYVLMAVMLCFYTQINGTIQFDLFL